jgi:hypothetical protein
MNAHSAKTFDAAAYAAPADLDRLQRTALIAGGVGLAVLAAGFFLSPVYFLRAYLLGWVSCMALVLGSLGFCMLNHMTHGAWGITARRIYEAACKTLPLLFLLFLPIVLGMKELYAWHPAVSAPGDHVIEAKRLYLNPTSFNIRFVLYFLIWGFFSWQLSKNSQQQDIRSTPKLVRRFQIISGPGIVVFILTLTFAVVDWVMSLQPHWYSTIYGVYFLACAGLMSLTFVVLIAHYLKKRGVMADVFLPSVFHDWGKLIFAFNMLWAYFCFSQFLITWSGNLPEETSWYLQRMHGIWGWMALVVIFGHFLIPFAILLSRDIKRDSGRLAKVSLFLMVLQVFDFFWQIEPSFAVENAAYWWLYLVAPVALGGIWLAAFLYFYKRRPLLPVNDPYLAESIAHEH